MNRLLASVAVLVAWLPTGAYAVNYYVDAAIGNDTYSGTSATVQNGGSNLGPWQTLTKVNSAALQPGDAVYFRCGQSWRGVLRVASSTDPARPTKYSQFGSDCNGTNAPTITASMVLTGWQQYQDSVYVASTWLAVARLYADGVALRVAQHPNPDHQSEAWARGMFVVDQSLTAPSLNRGFVDAELASVSDRDLTGAGIHIRVNDFTINDRTITSFDPASRTITINQATTSSIRPNWGYYLDNKLWMLDTPGEYHVDASDPANVKVYVWMPDGGAPASRVVGAANSYGIDATNAANVQIIGLRVDKTGTGISMSGSTNVVVRSVEISDSLWDGIAGYNAVGGTIEASSIARSVREGIQADGAIDFRIVNNRVLDSGNLGPPVQSRGGITAWGGRSVAIKSNTVTNSGYHGIAYGRSSEIANNRVEHACLVLNDCGGIYTSNPSSDYSPNGSTVFGNIVTGVYGNPNGRDPAQTNALTPGIYLDYRTNAVYVGSNTVSDAYMGIFIHAAFSNTVSDNTFYNFDTHAVFLKEYAFALISSPNRVQRNKYFARRDGPAVLLQPQPGRQASLATFDQNRYSAMYTATGAALDVTRINTYQNGQWSIQLLSLGQWQQAGNDQGGTVFDQVRISPYAFQPVDGTNLLANGTFASDTSGWLAYGAQGDATLSWSGDCQIPGCATLTAGAASPSGNLVSNVFPVTPGKSYVVRFSDRSLADQVGVTVVPRMAGPRTYDAFQSRFPVPVTTSWQNHSVLFSVPSDLVLQPGDLGGRVDFIVPAGRSVQFDNVRLEEAIYTSNDPADDSLLLVNPTSLDGTFSCPDSLTDPAKCTEYVAFDTGAAVSWPVIVGPRKSAILVWAGNPFRFP
jgi:parallel beta-helix repeat protein